MTVESVRLETFGPVLDCIWFDREDCLRFGRFPLKAIDIFPRSLAEKSLSAGLEVRLRSRGPVMTISHMERRDGLHYASCLWNGPMGRERQRLFPVETLVLTMMERFEGYGGQPL